MRLKEGTTLGGDTLSGVVSFIEERKQGNLFYNSNILFIFALL
jgi:hypothetical protein